MSWDKHQMSIGSLPAVSIKEIERLARIEHVLRVRARAARRGSWFNVSYSFSPKQIQAYRLALSDRNQCKNDPELQMLKPLDVICMHCQTVSRFLTVVQLRVALKLTEHVCEKCRLPLWRPGVFRSAKLAFELTGDFNAFEKMLVYPPKDLGEVDAWDSAAYMERVQK